MFRNQLIRTTRLPIRVVMTSRTVADNAGLSPPSTFLPAHSNIPWFIGAVGGTRPGGSASSDSFNKREKAAEDMVTPPPFTKTKNQESSGATTDIYFGWNEANLG